MRTNIHKTWEEYFQDAALNQELSTKYLAYVDDMQSRGVPPVFEFRHLCLLLGRTEGYLASVVNAADAHYRTFVIPKRRGGYREICAPYPALLECQRWINRNILARGKVHPVSHGFRQSRSIVTNAHPHLGAGQLLKLDLRDFFGSISFTRVVGVFRSFGYPPNVAFYLSRISCRHGVLPQGAATSPFLSNIIAYRMDCRLYGLAKYLGIRYTRYADDLTFSGEAIPRWLAQGVSRIAKEENFELNHEKTRFCRSGQRQVVTGISISCLQPRLTRDYRRRIRQEVHYILRYGLVSHVSRRRIREPFYLSSLYGRLLFWKWVEPDNAFVCEVLPKLKKLLSS